MVKNKTRIFSAFCDKAVSNVHKNKGKKFPENEKKFFVVVFIEVFLSTLPLVLKAFLPYQEKYQA